jgi:hypothetical protein
LYTVRKTEWKEVIILVEMDCPTNADIPLMVDESLARDLLGLRFNEVNFRKMTDTDGKMSRETFLLELDHVDVYISHDRNFLGREVIHRINQILNRKGLSTIYEEGKHVEVSYSASKVANPEHVITSYTANKGQCWKMLMCSRVSHETIR